MKTICLVRHGQSKANAQDLTAGTEIDSPLTKKGRLQAQLTGEKLSAESNFDLIVSSPMKRALETANIIAEMIGYPTSKILTSDFFTERSIGSLAGKPYQEYLAAVAKDPTPKDVESLDAMYGRVQKGFAWLRDLPAKRVILVSHDGIGKMIKVVEQKLKAEDLRKLSDMDNSTVYRFTL